MTKEKFPTTRTPQGRATKEKPAFGETVSTRPLRDVYPLTELMRLVKRACGQVPIETLAAELKMTREEVLAIASGEQEEDNTKGGTAAALRARLTAAFPRIDLTLPALPDDGGGEGQGPRVKAGKKT